jgi:TonB family protein
MMNLVIGTPEKERPSREFARLGWALVLALAAHVAVAGLVVLSSRFPSDEERRRSQRANSKAVTLRGLTAEQWSKNRGAASPQVKDERRVIAKNRDERKEEKKPEVVPKGQIVDVAPGNGEVDPNAKYVAETSNKTARETKAKEQTAFYRNAMPRRTSSQPIDGNGTDAAERAQQAGNLGLGTDDRPLRTASPKMAMEVPDLHRQQPIALKVPSTDGPGLAVSNRHESQEMKGNSRRLNLREGSPDQGEESSAGRAGQPGTLTLLPSPAVLDKVAGAAANDHLQDLAEGDGTYLNTREWRFASFFNRVKQSVGQQWTPQSQLRLRDPTGNIYSGRDRYTLLSVTLDHDGRLKDAFVERSSGLDFLDLEAVKAFERAQPFPNPPPALLATDSTIRFQFGFFLELTGRPGFRLFRSAE